jgi:hypothetical protein
MKGLAMKLYSKISVLFNFLTVGVLLSLWMIAEYMLNLSHKFVKEQYPAIELTLKNIYQKYITQQQLAI